MTPGEKTQNSCPRCKLTPSLHDPTSKYTTPLIYRPASPPHLLFTSPLIDPTANHPTSSPPHLPLPSPLITSTCSRPHPKPPPIRCTAPPPPTHLEEAHVCEEGNHPVSDEGVVDWPVLGVQQLLEVGQEACDVTRERRARLRHLRDRLGAHALRQRAHAEHAQRAQLGGARGGRVSVCTRRTVNTRTTQPVHLPRQPVHSCAYTPRYTPSYTPPYTHPSTLSRTLTLVSSPGHSPRFVRSMSTKLTFAFLQNSASSSRSSAIMGWLSAPCQRPLSTGITLSPSSTAVTAAATPSSASTSRPMSVNSWRVSGRAAGRAVVAATRRSR